MDGDLDALALVVAGERDGDMAIGPVERHLRLVGLLDQDLGRLLPAVAHGPLLCFSDPTVVADPHGAVWAEAFPPAGAGR
jgi:hypothetical protein